MNWKHPKWPGVIQRKEAWAWIAVFVAYTLLMFYQETHSKEEQDGFFLSC